jgi:hypothetical protein
MTSLAEAARQPSVAIAAQHYTRMGISVIPCVGKRPTVRWEVYQARRATMSEIYWWQDRGLLKNIGVVCGSVSRNLVVIDLDGLNAVSTYVDTFPQLAETFSVKTGSGAGMHFYYRLDELPQNMRAMNISGGGNIEIRASGCYVIAPPSIHPDTALPYAVQRPYPAMHLSNLSRLEKWLKRLMELSKPKAAATVNGRDSRAIGFGYAMAALNRETDKILESNEGNRNATLNRAAYNLGQLVADGKLDRHHVEARLFVAAVAVGQYEREARATIKSGLEAGMLNPRSRRHG